MAAKAIVVLHHKKAKHEWRHKGSASGHLPPWVVCPAASSTSCTTQRTPPPGTQGGMELVSGSMPTSWVVYIFYAYLFPLSSIVHGIVRYICFSERFFCVCLNSSKQVVYNKI